MKTIKYILFVLFILVTISPLAAQNVLEIVNVKVTNGTCLNNGKIEIIATGDTESLRYMLYDKSANKYVTDVTQETNIFLDRGPGDYRAEVYDKFHLTTPVTKDVTLTTTYKQLGIASVTPSLKELCGTHPGQIYFVLSNYVAPYNYTYKLKNHTTGEVFIKENVNTYYYYFTGLSAGKYSHEILDRCGNGLSSTEGVYTTIEAGFEDVLFTKFTKASWYPDFIYQPGCTKDQDKLSIRFYNSLNSNYYILNDLYDVSKYPFDWTIEYNGTLLDNDWKKSNVTGYSYWYIDNFDYLVHNASKGKVRLAVKHPCTGAIIYSDYTTNSATYSHTISAYAYPNAEEFCKQATTFDLSIGQSFYSTTCTESNNLRIYKDNIKINEVPFPVKNSAITINDLQNTGGYRFELWSPSNVKISEVNYANKVTTTYSPPLDNSYHTDNYATKGNYNTFNMRVNPAFGWNAKSLNNLKTVPVTYTMLLYPTNGYRSPSTIYITSDYTYYTLWEDLPYGKYEIKITSSAACNQTITVTKNQSIKGFQANTYVEQGTESSCDKYNLKTKATFLNMSNVPIGSNSVYTFIKKQGSDTWIRLGSVYADNTDRLLISNINNNSSYGPGEYTIKYYCYEAYTKFNANTGMTPENNFNNEYPPFATNTFTVPEYKLPNLELYLSGGITCDDTPGGTGGTLTMTGKDGNAPYTYRYRAYDTNLPETDLTGYTSWLTPTPPKQFVTVPGMSAGRYTVQTKDKCGNFTTQNVKIFSGTEQFIGLVSSFDENTVCETSNAEITVLSIGPVVSYQWYKNGTLLYGKTSHKLVITDMKDTDEGTYSVRVNNGVCSNLQSSLKIRMLPVLVPVNDTLTLLPYQEKMYDLFANDTIASCNNNVAPYNLTPADIQVNGYAKGVLVGDFGKIELMDDGGKINFCAPESYTKDVIDFTYDVSITINGVLYKKTGKASFFLVQPTNFPSTVCYGDSYTFNLKKLSPNTSFTVSDELNNPITLPAQLNAMTSSKTYKITPSVDLKKYPTINYTVQVIPQNGSNIRWKGTSDQVWNNYNNWVLKNANGTDGAKINWVPSTCVNAEIPSNSPRYPITSYNSSIGKIEMKDRAMIGNSHKLNYKSVTIETLFKQAELGRWIMYSPPLKAMYSGDFILTNDAGKNIENSTWMSFFQTLDPDEGTVTGPLSITRPISDMAQELRLGKSFLLKVKDISGTNTERLRLPDLSADYTYYKAPADVWGSTVPSDIKTSQLLRNPNGGKFIIDKDDIIANSNTITVSIADLEPGSEVVMISNPFPAYLDIKYFLVHNNALLEPVFWIWDGQLGNFMKFNDGRGDTWTIKDVSIIKNNVATSNDFIAPFQSFFAIRKNTTGTQLDVVFEPEDMTTSNKLEKPNDYTFK